MTDGVSSSRLNDRAVALQVCIAATCINARSSAVFRRQPAAELTCMLSVQRLAAAGALLSSSEMALFQLAGDAKHPAFKQISALAKEKRPEPITPVSNL